MCQAYFTKFIQDEVRRNISCRSINTKNIHFHFEWVEYNQHLIHGYFHLKLIPKGVYFLCQCWVRITSIHIFLTLFDNGSVNIEDILPLYSASILRIRKGFVS